MTAVHSIRTRESRRYSILRAAVIYVPVQSRVGSAPAMAVNVIVSGVYLHTED